MKDFEKLAKRIIEVYEKNNLDKDRINLEIQCSYMDDPSLKEYQDSIKEKVSSNLHEINISDSKNLIEDIEYLEELEEEIFEEETQDIDLEILEKVDENVLSILHYLNIGIYNISELKRLIINDTLEHFLKIGIDENVLRKMIESIPKRISKEKYVEDLKKINDSDLKIFFSNCFPTDKYEEKNRYLANNLTDKDKIKLWCIFNNISWYIERHIDYEFKEYERRKMQIIKDLLTDLMLKIKKEVDNRFYEHKLKRSKKINKLQINNFLNYLLDLLDENYIKPDKTSKKLNNEDYLFLKKKVKKYIFERYEKEFLIKA